MRTLNLGIPAHVDPGKTSLTERLLQAAGVIDEISSVDDGSTQTDSLLHKQRRLPALTRGQGVLERAFDGYQRVRSTIPTRPRLDHNPVKRKEYWLHVIRRV